MCNSNCIFCRIVKGEVFTYRIFEDHETLAFLDAYPLSRGHTLIIPKIHVARLEDLQWENAHTLFRTLHKLAGKIQVAVEASSSTIAINNGPESGQEIPHIHLHVIPRFTNDRGGPIHAIMRSRPSITQEEMVQIARKIRDCL